MRSKNHLYAQAATLLALALAVTQLSRITAQDLPDGSSAPLSGGPQSIDGIQTAPRVAPHAKVLVDGRTHPEEVSDELAFRLYLKSMVLPENPSAQQVLRQTAFVKQLGLPDFDETQFVEALRDMGPDLMQLDRERRDLSREDPSSGYSKFQSLKDREGLALDSARVTLLGRLSPAGRDKLNAHLRSHVKSRIVLFEMDHSAH
jgi:hypothetical protein